MVQMEAAQPGGAAPDQAAVDAALAQLAQDVADVQTRVSSDLDTLKQQLAAAQAAGQQVDLTEVITQIESIQVSIQQIDPSAAAVPASDPTTGDQGPVSEGGSPPAPADQPPPEPGAAPADTTGSPAGEGSAGDVGGGQPPSQ